MWIIILLLAKASVTPCQYEDQSGCYWNAQVQGNGEGRSFITLTENLTIYL